jgi:hypothetical protein
MIFLRYCIKESSKPVHKIVGVNAEPPGQAPAHAAGEFLNLTPLGATDISSLRDLNASYF